MRSDMIKMGIDRAPARGLLYATGQVKSAKDMQKPFIAICNSYIDTVSYTHLPVLFIGPRYQEEPEWRKDALKQLDPQIKQVLLEGLGHELYTEAPEIVAREVNNWLQNVHK